MVGRVKRKVLAAIPTPHPPLAVCALCERALGANVEWHHPVPKSEGGRDTVPLHPICHRAIHAAFDNAELARLGGDPRELRKHDALASSQRWIADKSLDFHAPTHRGKH
jgi:hypothetical protein